jgi:GAF domain-containing protein
MMVDEEVGLCPVVATDEPGRLLETRQEQSGHGPCVDALTLDRIIATADLGTDDRWPMLGAELAAAGVRAVLGVPIHAGGVPVGSLNVYYDRPGEWHESGRSALAAYAGLIDSLLLTALQAREKEQLADQLQHALDNRVVIERGVGVVMARERIDAVSAFNRLRKSARSTERKVVDVAAELLAEITAGQ